MALWRNIKCHRNIFRIYFFIRKAGKLGLPHHSFLLTQTGVWKCFPGIETEKQGDQWVHLLTFIGFLKDLTYSAQIIHLLPSLFASCDHLVGTEWLTLSYLLSLFPLRFCLKVRLPSRWPQPASWGELRDSSTANPVFTGSSFLPGRKRGIDY